MLVGVNFDIARTDVSEVETRVCQRLLAANRSLTPPFIEMLDYRRGHEHGGIAALGVKSDDYTIREDINVIAFKAMKEADARACCRLTEENIEFAALAVE
jgi:hypothetical protein